MGLEDSSYEERLKSFLVQLETESGILERIIYEGKNQHRRCLYFQNLLKVRRDVRLLQSARLENILKSLSPLIKGNKPAQTVHLLESLKKRKVNAKKYNIQERLLGDARLLSQVFREYHPSNEEIVTLECIWKGDKFVLLERTNKSEINDRDGHLEVERDRYLGSSMIKYQSIKPLLGEDGLDYKMDTDCTFEECMGSSGTDQHKTDTSIKIDDRTVVEDCGNDEGHLTNAGSPNKNHALESVTVASTSPCPCPSLKSPKLQSGSKKKVAYLSVRKSTASKTNKTRSPVKATTTVQLSADDNGDPFFSLLTSGEAGDMKDSLF